LLKYNSDERGFFVELYKESEERNYKNKDPKQISYITINKGFFRGGHFHKETMESFILLEGDCSIFLSCKHKDDADDATCFDGEEHKLDLYSQFDVPLTFQHTLFSRAGAKLLILSSKEFDPNNPDTFIL